VSGSGAAGIDLVFDVDGVFNAFPPMAHRKGLPRYTLNWGWDCEPVEVDVIGFPITYSTTLIERVHALVERPDVDAYWLTTWCENAPTDLCPRIGLNGQEWPVLGVQDRLSRRPGWWKWPAIRRHVEGTSRRVIWIDDDLAAEKDAQRWIERVNDETPGRLLGIAPETHNGLTLALLDFIERWVESPWAEEPS
jgi:hypothetical protein